jgi:hypothetical protein
MPRRGQRDRQKEGQWRRLLRQWRRSGQTVRDFCRERQVSEPSFYSWRRTIVQRDRQARGERRQPPTRRDERTEQGKKAPLFVPVRVTPTPMAPAFELVLGNGRLVRVPSGFDAGTLRQLLAVLEELPSC